MSEAPKEAPPAKKSKMLLIVGLLVLLLGGGGGGAWFLMNKKPPPDADSLAENQRKLDLKSRVYVPLDPFTVNLADEGDSRMAQIAMVLEVNSNEVAEEIKSVTPNIRNQVLMLLSAKKAADILSVEGKEQLAREVGESVATQIGLPTRAFRKVKARAEPEDDEDHDDEEAEEGGKTRAAKARARNRAPVPPVRVNFAQFIVQ